MPPANAHFKRRNTILLLFVAVVISLWSNGFNLRPFHFSDRFDILQLVGNFLILFATALCMMLVSWERYIRNFYFWAIIGLLAAALFPTFVNLVIVNNLSLIEVFRSGLFYCGYFIFILLICYRTDFSFVTRLNSIIIGICTANVMFLILIAHFPGVANSLLVVTGERYDQIRLYVAFALGPMVGYSTFYLLAMWTRGSQSPRAKMFYAAIFCVNVWY